MKELLEKYKAMKAELRTKQRQEIREPGDITDFAISLGGSLVMCSKIIADLEALIEKDEIEWDCRCDNLPV